MAAARGMAAPAAATAVAAAKVPPGRGVRPAAAALALAQLVAAGKAFAWVAAPPAPPVPGLRQAVAASLRCLGRAAGAAVLRPVVANGYAAQPPPPPPPLPPLLLPRADPGGTALPGGGTWLPPRLEANGPLFVRLLLPLHWHWQFHFQHCGCQPSEELCAVGLIHQPVGFCGGPPGADGWLQSWPWPSLHPQYNPSGAQQEWREAGPGGAWGWAAATWPRLAAFPRCQPIRVHDLQWRMRAIGCLDQFLCCRVLCCQFHGHEAKSPNNLQFTLTERHKAECSVWPSFGDTLRLPYPRVACLACYKSGTPAQLMTSSHLHALPPRMCALGVLRQQCWARQN